MQSKPTDIIAASLTRFLISAPENPIVRKTSCLGEEKEQSQQKNQIK
jgi:hypothetical protein